MRAVGYFTVDESARSGRFARAELTAAFAAYCEERRHVPHGTFEDPVGEGGGAGWRAMAGVIRESGLGYLVVVPDAERLGASLEDQTARVLEMDALASQVVCDDLEFPDPLQNALRGSDKAALRGERIRAGMMAKAAKGLGLGKPPYGYRLTFDGAFHVVPGEAETVAAIFDGYLEPGGSVRSVAAALNARRKRTRNGKRWSIVAVRDVLRNPAYIGTYRRFGLRIPSSYAPIVSPSVFRQAQDRLLERGPSPRLESKPSPVFLLSGLLVCGYCGRGMLGVSRRQTWRRKDGERVRAEYRYYQCQSRVNQNQCAYRTAKATETEEEAARAAREALESGERGRGADPVARRGAAGKAKALTEMESLDRQFREGVRRAASGSLSLARLRGGLEQLRAVKRELAEKAAQEDDGAEPAAGPEANAARFLADWDGLAEAERRDLFRALVSKVTLRGKKVAVTLR